MSSSTSPCFVPRNYMEGTNRESVWHSFLQPASPFTLSRLASSQIIIRTRKEETTSTTCTSLAVNISQSQFQDKDWKYSSRRILADSAVSKPKFWTMNLQMTCKDIKLEMKESSNRSFTSASSKFMSFSPAIGTMLCSNEHFDSEPFLHTEYATHVHFCRYDSRSWIERWSKSIKKLTGLDTQNSTLKATWFHMIAYLTAQFYMISYDSILIPYDFSIISYQL